MHRSLSLAMKKDFCELTLETLRELQSLEVASPRQFNPQLPPRTTR